MDMEFVANVEIDDGKDSHILAKKGRIERLACILSEEESYVVFRERTAVRRPTGNYDRITMILKPTLRIRWDAETKEMIVMGDGIRKLEDIKGTVVKDVARDGFELQFGISPDSYNYIVSFMKKLT